MAPNRWSISSPSCHVGCILKFGPISTQRALRIRLEFGKLIGADKDLCFPTIDLYHGNVAALRYDNWQMTFLEQQAKGMDVWQQPFTALRAPLLATLRMDPFERAQEEHAMGYQR